MMENKASNYESSRKKLIQIIDTIRKPAGDSFGPKTIRENLDIFVKAYHGGLKKLHYALISDIMIFESAKEQFVNKKSQHLRDRKVKDSLDYINEILLVWRRANDCIAWIILDMDRNNVRRLCYGNPRGNLIDQNPDHVLEVLYKLNSLPFNLAIWNDTTTCIDVGDILAIDKKRGILSCIELKEGIVNEKIEKIIDSGCELALTPFLERYGDKGKKQYERSLKQRKKYSQSTEILKKNKGIDPYFGQEMRIAEVRTPDEDYHKELDDLIDCAREKGTSINLINECLWIFAFNQNQFSYTNMVMEFSAQVISHEGESLKKWLAEFSPRQNSRYLYPIYNIIAGLKIPESLPIFLFEISPKNVLDILLKNIVVLMFLKWNNLKNLYEKNGISLKWSSKKEGRREKSKPGLKRRGYILGERIPMLKKGERELWIGPGIPARIYFDGIRPKCIVDQGVEMFDLYMKTKTH